MRAQQIKDKISSHKVHAKHYKTLLMKIQHKFLTQTWHSFIGFQNFNDHSIFHMKIVSHNSKQPQKNKQTKNVNNYQTTNKTI